MPVNVHVQMPSCVPSAPGLEHAGAELTVADVAEAMTWENIIGLGEVMVWDTARPYHYARWTADRRLVLGGGDRPQLTGPRRVRAFRDGIADLRRHFERLLPALAAIKNDFAWEGLFATTPDGLPYIGAHAEYPRHLFALGYGGNGMTFGFLAARLLLDWHRGGRSPDQQLFAFERERRKRLQGGT